MIARENLDFPATNLERMKLLSDAATPFEWADLSEGEKIAFVRGMERGYQQGARELAIQAIGRFTQAVIGFKP